MTRHTPQMQHPPATTSAIRRAVNTPARDWIRGNLSGRLDWKRTIDSADLPEPVKEIIMTTLKHTRLWRLEKADLATELIAHFADGLHANATAEQLVERFGDPKTAGRLMGRAKRRNRPRLVKAFIRTLQGIVVFLGLLLCLYGFLTLRYTMGKPKLSRNYAAEYNATIEQIPLQDRAWDLYAQTFAMMSEVPKPLLDAGWPDIAPTSPLYQQALEYLNTHQDVLAIVHKAAAKPRLGALLSDTPDPRIVETLNQSPSTPVPMKKTASANPSMLEIILPELGQMRKLARLLLFDAHVAARNHQSARAANDINTLVGLARHAADRPLLINDMVGIAIYESAVITAAQIMHEDPTLFDDDQLQQFAHRFAGFMGGNITLDLEGEHWMFEDMIQRIYSDDGHGNGHITKQGMINLSQMYGNEGSIFVKEFGTSTLAPVTAAIIADRADMIAKYNELMTSIQQRMTLPMWALDQNDRAQNEIDALQNNPVLSTRYFPVAFFIPALDTAHINAEKTIQWRDGVLAGIALELYRRKHGHYPDSLDALVPTYLPEVPLDRFTGKPLHYGLFDGKPRVWSVGTDRNDDGGIPPIANERYEQNWKPARTAAQLEQDEPKRYDGDWILWPIEYMTIDQKDSSAAH